MANTRQNNINQKEPKFIQEMCDKLIGLLICSADSLVYKCSIALFFLLIPGVFCVYCEENSTCKNNELE